MFFSVANLFYVANKKMDFAVNKDVCTRLHTHFPFNELDKSLEDFLNIVTRKFYSNSVLKINKST